jgi:hypothetical protein
MRGHLGLDPYANPAADRPMVLTATGYVPIEAGADGMGAGVGTDTTAEGNAQGARTFVLKAAVNDTEHPGWPAGTPGGRGGQFRPKDGEDASSNNAHAESDVTPDNTWISGARYAGGVEEGDGENRVGGGSGGGTPAQEARLAIAEAQLQSVLSQLRVIDPNWKPTAGFHSTIEREIADFEAQAQQAQNRLSELTGVGAEPPSEGGHHYVPKSLYKIEPLSPETRNVFDEASSGPLADATVNSWTTEHRNYNDAVREAFRIFLAQNGITPDRMTPDQAREFLAEVFRSNDPRILEFNLKIFEERRR